MDVEVNSLKQMFTYKLFIEQSISKSGFTSEHENIIP